MDPLQNKQSIRAGCYELINPFKYTLSILVSAQKSQNYHE